MYPGKPFAAAPVARCAFEGCLHNAISGCDFCRTHGGRKRCEMIGCTKFAQAPTARCKAHGGGYRCRFPGCSKSAASGVFRCTNHQENMVTFTEAPANTAKTCQFPDCEESGNHFTYLCKTHGGGKRCKTAGCTKSACGKTLYCVAHGGGKRCKYEHCRKSAVGATDFCVQHGGGRRCALVHCNRSAKSNSMYCHSHQETGDQKRPVAPTFASMNPSMGFPTPAGAFPGYSVASPYAWPGATHPAMAGQYGMVGQPGHGAPPHFPPTGMPLHFPYPYPISTVHQMPAGMPQFPYAGLGGQGAASPTGPTGYSVLGHGMGSDSYTVAALQARQQGEAAGLNPNGAGSLPVDLQQALTKDARQSSIPLGSIDVLEGTGISWKSPFNQQMTGSTMPSFPNAQRLPHSAQTVGQSSTNQKSKSQTSQKRKTHTTQTKPNSSRFVESDVGEDEENSSDGSTGSNMPGLSDEQRAAQELLRQPPNKKRAVSKTVSNRSSPSSKKSKTSGDQSSQNHTKVSQEKR